MLTKKDKLALPLAILLGGSFGYFSTLAGYGGVLVGGFFGIVIVPLVVLFVADQRKLLVWQACIVPFALWIIIENSRLGALGRAEGLGVFYFFWAIGSVISSPIVIFLYWKRSKGRVGHQVVWLLLGLVFVGLVCSLWHDPFLFFGLSLVWIVACLLKFAWEWRRAAEPGGPKTAILVAFLVFVLTISTAALTGLFFKQQAFRSAINHRYFRLAHLFVAIGADPNGRDQFGETALVDAAWNGVGDLNAVNALISMGANVNQEQQGALHGMLPSGTALDVAASAGRAEICQALLEAGASVDAKNRAGATPLVIGLGSGSIACVPALLSHGANVNAIDMQGKTALIYLMSYSPDDPTIQNILRVLLARGADVNVKDANGKTAEDLAKENKHEHFMEQLRSPRESRN